MLISGYSTLSLVKSTQNQERKNLVFHVFHLSHAGSHMHTFLMTILVFMLLSKQDSINQPSVEVQIIICRK